MDNDTIIERCNILYSQIQIYLNELSNNSGDSSVDLQKLVVIYCTIYKDKCLETDNLIIFKILIEQFYDFKFVDDNAIQKLLVLIQQTNEIIQQSMQNEQKYMNIGEMSGAEFEKLIADLLEKMGFDVELTKTTGDGGIDIIAYNCQPFIGGKYIVQCKRWSESVGEPPVRDLYGVVMSENANKGILITNSNFTNNAINFAKGKPIELIDGQALHQLFERYNIELSENPTYENDTLKEIFEWDEITLLRNELRNDSNNHNLRMRLISKLQFNLYSVFNDYSRYQLIALCDLLEEQLKILGNIKCSPSDKNLNFLKYTSYVAISQVNLIRGNIGASIRNLNKVFEWDEVTNAIEKENNLEDLYVYSTYNMIQLLYLIGLDSKAQSIKIKHYRIFDETIKTAKRIVSTQQLDPNTKDFFQNQAYNLENCIYTKEFYKFEYSWIGDISDVNGIYKKLKYGMGYNDYSMGGSGETFIIRFDDLYNAEYSKIYDFDESKFAEWRKTINVII